MHTVNHTTDDIRPPTPNQCTCGQPGAVYADDQVTVLCGRCWWAIYGEERDDA